jgi:hypothetical protein
MSADEIREIIRQELAAFFAAPVRPQRADELDTATTMRIRSAAQNDLAAAMARKATKRRAA